MILEWSTSSTCCSISFFKWWECLYGFKEIGRDIGRRGILWSSARGGGKEVGFWKTIENWRIIALIEGGIGWMWLSNCIVREWVGSMKDDCWMWSKKTKRTVGKCLVHFLWVNHFSCWNLNALPCDVMAIIMEFNCSFLKLKTLSSNNINHWTPRTIWQPSNGNNNRSMDMLQPWHLSITPWHIPLLCSCSPLATSTLKSFD